jgi:predicted phosphodiesterase
MATTLILMSDIHGNLPALEAVAASLPPCDAVYVAGDLCLDGPAPAQVVDFLIEHEWLCVMGNTDRDIISSPLPSKHRAMIEWTRDQLGQSRLKWLADLPFSLRFDRGDSVGKVLVVHANPRNMDTHLPPTVTREELRPYLEGVDADILAFGHLHTPYLRPVDGILLADVSSVGHPKDLDRRAAYTVVRWEGERRSVEQARVPYDVDETLRLYRESGMPDAEKESASLLKASY